MLHSPHEGACLRHHTIHLCLREIEPRVLLLESFQKQLLLQLLFSEGIDSLMSFEDARPQLSLEGFMQDDVEFFVLDQPARLLRIAKLGEALIDEGRVALDTDAHPIRLDDDLQLGDRLARLQRLSDLSFVLLQACLWRFDVDVDVVERLVPFVDFAPLVLEPLAPSRFFLKFLRGFEHEIIYFSNQNFSMNFPFSQ